MTHVTQNQSFVWGNSLISANGVQAEDGFYYLQDNLGSLIRLIGENESDTLAYDEFGVALVQARQNEAKFNQPFGFTGYQTDSISGLYYAQARYFMANIDRFNGEDGAHDGVNWYEYCRSNPLMYVDRNGCAAVFAQINDEWRFIMDNKGINVSIGVFGFVPFLDDAIWGVTNLATGNKTISQNLYQEIGTRVGASLGASSTAADLAGISGNAGKLAKLAGRISTIATASNLVYMALDNRPHYNHITARVFGSYYGSSSFETTAARFLAYSVITEELVEVGAITYQTKWGIVDSFSIDWDKFNTYFDELGVTAKDFGQLITMCD